MAAAASNTANGNANIPKAQKKGSKMENQHGSTSRSSKSRRKGGARRQKSGTGWTAWFTDKVLKVLVWYSIITLAFRCPKDLKDITDESPRICKPSLQLKNFVNPYVQPYYDQYAAPYVQKAQPYIDQVNEKAYQPGLAAYQQYGAPRVAGAQKFGTQQWERTVRPQLEVARKEAGKQYDLFLAPHVQKVQGIAQPYYDSITTSASDIWELEVQPVYRRTSPYAQQLYTQGRQFTVTTVLPQAQNAADIAWTFVLRQIWPKVRVLYGETVEPQLMRITERLGRYKDEKKLQAEIKSMESSSKAEDKSSSASSASSSQSSVVSKVSESPSSAASSAVYSSSTPEPEANPADEFKEELKSWEEISHTAADEGAADLKERIADITAHQKSKQAEGVGNALVVQLEETAEGAINSVKARVQSVVADLPEDADDDTESQAYDNLAQGIRAAGQTVKHRAQAIRDWHASYIKETQDLVDKALQSTVETVDGIRELRLTEIGRKYSSKKLSHKDWSQYNDLKKASGDWHKEVERDAKNHNGLGQAKQAGDEVESRGMSVAEDAAKELARLKNVAQWKISAHDASDDFDSKSMPAAAEKLRKKAADAMEGASEAVVGTSSSQGTVESASSVASSKFEENTASAKASASSASSVAPESASSVSSSVSSAASPSSKSAESVVSEGSSSALDNGSVASASKSAESVASKASSAAADNEAASSASAASASIARSENAAANSASSVKSRVADSPVSETLGPKAASILAAGQAKKDAASQSIVGSAEPSAESAASSVSSAADEASSSGSSVASEASSSVESAASAASDAGEQATKKVWGGAMAQAVPSSAGPILDEDIVDTDTHFSESIQSMVDNARDGASQLTQAVADAVDGGQSVASEQYQSGMSAASNVLYGSEKGAMESGTSMAAEQYQSAVDAASNAIYGSSTPMAASLSSQASAAVYGTEAPLAESVSADVLSHYNQALAQASSHYEVARSRVSAQISGTPLPIHEQMFSSIEAAYSDSRAAATSRLSEGQVAASSVTNNGMGDVQSAYASVSAIAASRLNEGLQSASAQYSSAKIAVGAEPTPASQQYLDQARAAYYQGIGYAHDQYSQFLSTASGAVGATPTPWHQAYVDSASSQYESAIAAASSNFQVLLGSASSAIGETPTPIAKSLYDSAAVQYDEAILAASAQLSAAQQKASEAIYGTPTGVAESYGSAASSALYGGETPWAEGFAAQAAQNWDDMISRASEQVYGTPPPFTATLNSYAAQATALAASQFAAIQDLFHEVVNDKEPDFTESVMSRLHSAYSTGYPAMASSASSYASDAYASASSAVEAVFTPPPTVEAMLDNIHSQLDSVVDAASSQLYGAEKGSYEQASDAAADAASRASEAVYGHETGYLEAVSSSMQAAAQDAQTGISEALFGTSTTSLPDAAASVYSSLSTAAGEQYDSMASGLSSAIYGPEHGAMESANERIASAVESARSRIAGFGSQVSEAAVGATEAVGEGFESVEEKIVDAAEEAERLAERVTEKVRDEL